MVYLLVIVAAVIVIAAIAYFTQRKSRDGVASFKRQIDALSPEARKPVVDQVQSVSDLRRSKIRQPEPVIEPVIGDTAEDTATDAAPVDDSSIADESLIDPSDPKDDPEGPAHGA